MARRRMIASSIWQDEWFGPLGFFEQALWIGLFSSLADDQGRMLDNPVVIRATVFPYKDVPLADIEKALAGFESAGRVIRYSAKGKRLIQITNWWKQQRAQWANASEWAPPDGWLDHVRTRTSTGITYENWFTAKPEVVQQGAGADKRQAYPISLSDNPEHEHIHEHEQKQERVLSSLAPLKANEPNAPPLELQSIYKSISRACHFLGETLTRRQIRSLEATGPPLLSAGATPALVDEWAEWWKAHDWRGRKGETPRPEWIQESWGAFLAGRTDRSTRQTEWLDKPQA